MRNEPVEDLLSSVLGAYQLRAGIYAHPHVCGAYQISTAGDKRAGFHLIGNGECWVHTKLGHEPIAMQAGDLVVLPHDAWHMITPEPKLRDEDVHMVFEGEGPYTTLLCGYFDFTAGQRNPLLDALPELIIVRGSEVGERFRHLSELMLIEIEAEELGARPVLDKLADTLFVMVVRHYLNASEEKRGLLAALADERLRRALNAMHRHPEKDWTLEQLGSEAAMSRSAFAQRFNEIVGTSPIDYLTTWRMTQAELMLRDPKASVASVMERVGYTAESSFRKAFKRVHGYGPGRLRRWIRQRTG